MTDKRRPLLVVEDDPALQKQMKWAFSDYDVALAGDRESAIAQLRRVEPAVVTVDLGLPPAADTTNFVQTRDTVPVRSSRSVTAVMCPPPVSIPTTRW